MRRIAITLLAALPGAVLADTPPPGALACTGCHGIYEGAPNALHDKTADEIAETLVAFRSGELDGTLMPRIAVAFDEAELRAIAEWFSAQEARP
jgi:cytochrome c553